MLETGILIDLSRLQDSLIDLSRLQDALNNDTHILVQATGCSQWGLLIDLSRLQDAHRLVWITGCHEYGHPRIYTGYKIL
jgi:hypothetical protein